MKKTTFFICLAVFLAMAGFAADEKSGPEVAPDLGQQPWVFDIEKITLENSDFRSARWTGTHLQMTLMAIAVGGEIGLEMHTDVDQFIRIEQGKGQVLMGKDKNALTYVQDVEDDFALFIPAGYWHNLLNTGTEVLKVYSIYGPPEHPAGTRHKTFAEAEAAHHDH